MKPDIKICGLKSAEAIERAVYRGANHIGFIFFEKSPRYIEPDVAGKLADAVRGKAKIVAVTVDPTNDELDEIVALLKPDMIQLHGNESPERVLTIKAVYGLAIMKVFSVRSADDLKRVEGLYWDSRPVSLRRQGAEGVRNCRAATGFPSIGACSASLTIAWITCFPVG